MPFATPRAFSRARNLLPSASRARLGAVAASAALATAVIVGSSVAASPASASPVATRSTTVSTHAAPAHTARRSTPHHDRAAQRANATRLYAEKVHAVIREASKQRGKPYVYGADGPRAFDCSGLVRYVFGHAVHRWLPHNAEAQYRSVHHIAHRSNLRVGDLVFQESGGYAFHVGIYAGHDRWWHAPHSGTHVRKQRIYRGHLYYGRVIMIRNQRR